MSERRAVVVVEDDPAYRTALCRLLHAGGYGPVGFGSAEEFLEAPSPADPLCCVLDINLGGMSGLELQEILKSRGSNVPVILMTAFDDPRLRARANGNGCLAYLSKGSDADVLLALLQSLLNVPLEF
jgi:FixJ family two-component response regulator